MVWGNVPVTHPWKKWVMAVRTRHDVFNCQTGIDTREILNCSKTGFVHYRFSCTT